MIRHENEIYSISSESTYGTAGSWINLLIPSMELKGAPKTEALSIGIAEPAVTILRKGRWEASFNIPAHPIGFTSGGALSTGYKDLLEGLFTEKNAGGTSYTVQSISGNDITLDSVTGLNLLDFVGFTDSNGNKQIRPVTAIDTVNNVITVLEAFDGLAANDTLVSVLTLAIASELNSVSLAISYGDYNLELLGGVVSTFDLTFDNAADVQAVISGLGKKTEFVSGSALSTPDSAGLPVCGLSGSLYLAKSGSQLDLEVTKLDVKVDLKKSLKNDILFVDSAVGGDITEHRDIGGTLNIYSQNLDQIIADGLSDSEYELFASAEKQVNAVGIYMPRIIIHPVEIPAGESGEIKTDVSFSSLYDTANSYKEIYLALY